MAARLASSASAPPHGKCGPRRPGLRRFALLAPLALAVLLVACGGSSDGGRQALDVDTTAAAGGEARSFLLGVSSQPASTSELAYRDAFDLAGEAGEVVLIQRTPPWEDFLPGATISSRTEQLTRLEKNLVEEHDLSLFLAVDATAPGDRSRLADLPDELAGAGFGHSDVRAAYVAYAKYLALNYKPDYLALGVEVDMVYAARGGTSFETFLSLYAEAYDAVKSVSAETLVFPTFQYENMLGILGTGEETLPSWDLVSRFEPRLDMLAVTSYPGLVFDNASELPADYYAALEDRVQKPVGLVSVGWNSGQENGAEPGDSDQVTYLYRVLAAAETLEARMLVWYLGRDPASVPPGFEPLASTGLYDAGGRPKNIWRVWLSSAARPAPPLP